MFTHLLVHSGYSLLYGTASVERLAAGAKRHGYAALALTDINNLYGVHRFIGACRGEGIRPVIGADIRTKTARAVVLVRSREGFSNLTQLITKRMSGGDFDMAAALERHRAGNIVLTDTPELLQDLSRIIPRGDEGLYAMITLFSKRAARFAEKLAIPLAAAGDVSFLGPEDYRVHRVLRAMAGRSSLEEVRAEDRAPEGALLFGPGEAQRLFEGFPGAIENAARIAERCAFNEIFDGFIFPEYTGNTAASVALLRERTIAGAELRYGELSDSVLGRIDYELGIIEAKGFAPYFLVVADIVKYASRTCGRGSAAASIVSYSLGITNVDPIRHNLYFERFLNPERVDPPDIDVDFAWDERDDVIERAMETYGREHSAMVCTINHFHGRSALRETARVYGMPESEINRFGKFILRTNPDQGSEHLDAAWKEILDIARRIIGLPRHLGVHVGGLVITPKPVSHYVPVERAPKGVPIVTWDKDDVEAAGLVKIDLLGNRSLAVVRDALANLRENGIEIDSFTWDPANDPATQELLARGDSMGVFYVESPAMRQLQKKTGRGDFEHLVIHSSIIRPAANRFIAEYVRRLGGGAYEPLHPRLDHILRETYGIMCYQEDVSKAAIALADFSAAEADGLRKILTRRDRETKLREYREKFREGAAKNGVDGETIDRIWEMIVSFEGYSFCKPHSASYAMVSFQSAYLKAHYPAEFMAAVISNGGGYYTASAYISEARRLGLTVLRPDVNESGVRYSGKGAGIRVGLMAVGGIHYGTIAALIAGRARGGPYRGLTDFQERVAPGESDAEALVSAGAFDSIADGLNRSEQLWAVLLHQNQAKKTAAAHAGPSLFPAPEKRAIPRKDLPEQEKRKKEYQRLGFLCNAHPLSLWEDRLKKYSVIKAKDLEKYRGREVSLIGWHVTEKQVLTAGGEPMEFVSFEDETAIYETVLFPKTYMKYGDLFDGRYPFLIRGKVENDMGALSINVRSVRKIS